MTVCQRLASPACVRMCERVRRVWKRQHSLASHAPRRGVARTARESVSSAKRWSSGGWPPLAWIPWRVVHLRVKVLARGTHARSHARTHACRARARARLVSPSGGARSRVYASTVCTFALQIAIRETWTHTRTYACTHVRTDGAMAEKCGQRASYYASMLCVYNRGHSCFAVSVSFKRVFSTSSSPRLI